MFDPQPDLLTFCAPPKPVVAVKCTAAKAKREAIMSAGGDAYAALLEKERAQRALYRKRHREKINRDNRARGVGRQKLWKSRLVGVARARGRKKGLGATIRVADLVWPTHCPVLGIELDYPVRTGERGLQRCQPNWPTLDRYDPTKGYVPGNVFVISYRANTLKNNATYEEILKVAKYLARRPRNV